jgi:signal transduction histidine kinase
MEIMGAKILIVDDEASIRKLLSMYLTGAGYECHGAEGVESAKEALALQTFDLLLCDLKMPDGSGLDLVRFAKEQYPQMGRVMITGFGAPEVASEIMALGVYGYIIKPVTRNVVLITVENALRHLRLDLHMQANKIELERDVSERAEKLMAIMDNIDVGVAMYDKDLKILELNRMLQQWFPKSSLGTKLPCYQEAVCLSGKNSCGNCPMTETFKTGKTFETTRTLSTEQREGEFRIVTSPISNAAGIVYAGIALYEDITEKMFLERDLRQAQKFEAVGQLAAGIAHEVNTPIQYIGDNISFLQDSFDDLVGILNAYDTQWKALIETGGVPAAAGREVLEKAEEADIAYLLEEIPKTFEQSLEGVRRVEKIVRAMKDFSHPGSDEKTTIDINKIIENTITVCRNEWKYVAEMQTELASDLPLVLGFAGEMSQVFLNIIVNGAHAISDVTQGGKDGKGTISIRTRKLEDRVEIRISDTGGGIPDAIQERVFDPFFTTKAQGKGTGQGLAIAHRVVVEKHQGTLVLESDKGKGTTFVIEIPFGQDE